MLSDERLFAALATAPWRLQTDLSVTDVTYCPIAAQRVPHPFLAGNCPMFGSYQKEQKNWPAAVQTR